MRALTSCIILLGSLCHLARPAQCQSPDKAMLELAEALIEAEIPARDNPDRIVSQLLNAARGSASSSATKLAIDMASGYAQFLADPAAALANLDGYLQLDPHPLAAQSAKAMRQQLLRRAGNLNPEEAERLFTGYASQVIAVGPFGDEGDFYTGVPFRPEIAFPEQSEELAGRYAAITSYPVSRTPRSIFLSLPRLGSTEKGCYYGLHQLHSDAAQPAYLEIDSPGSIEVFVNGELRTRVDRLSGPQKRIVYLPIRLLAGANQVLVKTTTNRSPTFSLRYLDARGAKLEACRELANDRIHPLLAADREDAQQLPPFVDPCSALASAAKAAPDDARLQIACMLAAYRCGDRNLGLTILRSFEASAPADQRLCLALARGYDLANRLPEEVRRNRSKSLLEAARLALPEHSWAVIRQSRLLSGEDQQEAAIRLLRDEIAAGRGGPEIYSQLHAILSGLRFGAEAEELRELWAAATPHDARPQLARSRSLSRGGQKHAALEVLLSFLGTVPGDPAARRQAMDIALEIGELAVASKLVGSFLAESRQLARKLELQLRLAKAKGDGDRVAELSIELANLPEANAQQLRRAGRELMSHGLRREALLAYRRSLGMDSAQTSLRRLIARLEEGGEEYPLIAKYRYSSTELLAGFESAERERSAPSSLVLDQMIIRYYEDAGSVTETHQIRRINDLRGVEAHEQAEQAANAGEVISLRTIGRDGLSYLPSRVAGSFSMPRLAPGVFIEEEYRDFSPSPGANPVRGTTFFFQSQDEPFLLSELVVILPPNARGSFRVRNFTGEVIEEELGDGYRAHIYRMRDVPRILPEPNSPDPQDVLPVVAFGEDRSLTAIPRAMHARLRAQLATNPLLEDQAAEICRGLGSDLQKAATIYDFVQEKIQDGNGNGSPTATLLRGQGDRFQVYLALLCAADLPLQLAIAAPAHESLSAQPEPFFLGEDIYPLPAAEILPGTPEAFTVYAGSPRYAPMGTISGHLMGAPMLRLSLGGQELSRLPSGDRSEGMGWHVRASLRLDASGKASLEARAEIGGDSGLQLAEQIRKLQANRRDMVAGSLAGQMFQGWTVESARLGAMEPGKGLSLEASLVKRQALSPAGSEFLMGLPISPTNLFASYGGPSERNQALQLSGFLHSSWEVEIDPGKGYRLAEIPESSRVLHPLLDHELNFSLEGQKLHLRLSLTRRPGRLAANRYPEWRQLLRRLDLAESGQIRLQAQ